MDEKFFHDAMEAVGLGVVIIDENTLKSPFRPLHPTLRKCKCGIVDSSHNVTKHITDLLTSLDGVSARGRETFWTFHGEVPYYGEEEEV